MVFSRFNYNLFFNSTRFKHFKFILILFFSFFIFSFNASAKEINVNGYYGVTKCTEIVSNNSSSIVDCSYFNSYVIDGTNTSYTTLEKAITDFSGTTSNYSIANSLFLFGYYNFIKDNYYTLNFVYDNGSYIDNNLSLTSLSDLSYGYFLNSDYVSDQGLSDLSYTATYDQNNNQGYISITFKATQNTSSYRFIIRRTPIFRNISFQYNQGIRVYLLNAIEEEDNSNALLGQITNQNSTIINQNQQAESTRQGIWETIKSLPSMFLDMLITLFIPDNFDFLYNLKDSLESKLGFIASVPLRVLEFLLNLANANWDSFDSVTFPSIEFFGVSFWNTQEISLQPAIDIFSPYKYITDILCVILCVNTLLHWYHSFTNGGGN